jgi:hypothetical protein
MQASVCLVLFGDGCLLVFDLQQNTLHAVASTSLARLSAAGTAVLPCCMEVVCTSSSSTSQLGSSSSGSGSGSRSLRLRTTSSSKSMQGSGNAAAHTGCAVLVGYSDVSTILYDLAMGGAAGGGDEAAVGVDSAVQALQQLLAGC